MPKEPTVAPLSLRRRRFVFLFFLLIFLVSIPVLWFYTTGYRFSFGPNSDSPIVGVGGIYISTDTEDVEFFIDEAQVTNYRLFRKAAYIQNISEGIHKVHVQGEGLQTWTKALPVHPHIVTEVFAFTTPKTPRISLLTEYTDASGTPVVRFAKGKVVTNLFPFATSTTMYIATTSNATTSLITSGEYPLVEVLFATTTQPLSRTPILRDRKALETLSTATTTKISQNMKLAEVNGEIQASWVGDEQNRPYYFCVQNFSASNTPLMYGEHVNKDLLDERDTQNSISRGIEELVTSTSGKRVCRDSIRIDRKGKEVRWFDFLPENNNLVVLLLDDGIYVVEVDDRAWQNTQLLYPGNNLEMRIDGSRIFVHDRDYFLEVFTNQ
jgi:hypothetical protein